MPVSKVYNMDCMEYMKDVPDNFFDLAIVDPPYGIGINKMIMGGADLQLSQIIDVGMKKYQKIVIFLNYLGLVKIR